MDRDNSTISAQISWVYTDDLDAAADFYARFLGLDCIRDAGGARIYRTADGACIGLCRAFADRVVEPKGGMISLVSDDVDGWYRRLLDRGLAIDAPPRRMQQFGIYSFFVRDPNGVLCELNFEAAKEEA